MNVLSVAFALMTVSDSAGGGSEQILWQVERGLVKAGHRSFVIAAEGSSVSGCLIPTPSADGEITDPRRHAAHRAHRKAIHALLESSSIDLIHFHGLDFPEYIPASGPPMLATLHLPINLYPKQIFDNPDLTLNFVSQSQAAACRYPHPGQYVPTVCNGIELSHYAPAHYAPAHKEDYLAVLARICPEKGIDTALRVAHRLDLRLIVGGPVHPFPSHQAYFNERVKPLLDDKREYIGPVDLPRKICLLARAKCLLAPSSIAETSSLVAMEAIASGTPVIAFRSGALPEVVEHERTGFIVDSEDEMANAVLRIGEISPEVCRQAAVTRFDGTRMTREYLALYERLRSNSSLQRRMGLAPQSVL